MNATIGDIVGFYKKHPECVGKINVLTRFGYKQIQAADITAYNSEVYKIKTECGKIIKTSPDHLMLSDDIKWVKTKDLSQGKFLFTKDGPITIESIRKLKTKSHLYDLQVSEVKEFFANGLVSHNSSILDSLSFVLYGKPFRKINKPQLINSINQKNLVVEIEFSIGKKQYKVVRGMKPNIFEIYCNGEMINQSADARDYQEMLEKSILKLNHKSFSQVVILGSASFVPFMQLSASHRREIIEDLLDIQIFSIMNSLLKDDIILNKSELTEAKYKLESVLDKIEIHNKHIESIKIDTAKLVDEKQEKANKLQTQVAEIIDLIDILHTQADQLNEKLVGQSKMEDKYKKLINLQNQIGDKIKRVDKETEFFNIHDSCPTCNQSISEDFKHSKVCEKHQQKDKLINGLDQLQIELGNVIDQVEQFKTVSNQIVETNKNIAIKNTIVNGYKDLIREIEIEIASLQMKHVDGFDNTKELNDLTEQSKSLEVLKVNLEEQKQLLEVAAVLLKDTGIKTKIIKQYIPVINKLINKYLASMDFFVNFELDENFEEKIKSRFRDEFSYGSFSEGEKARLDLALLFTWRSIAKLRNSASTNLLILDEVFDGSLDSSGNDELLKILQTLTLGNNVFVISHKTDAYLDKFDKVLKFEKHKNFSRIIEA